MSTPCTSGKHHWIDTVSAARCCAPGWKRQLRDTDEFMEGDADDGVTYVHGETLRWVWNFSGAPTQPPTRTVRIPAHAEHGGTAYLTLTLPWTCLHCGGPRGEPFPTRSYDGSRTLACDGWVNPCGHVETYSAVRAAAAIGSGEPA